MIEQLHRSIDGLRAALWEPPGGFRHAPVSSLGPARRSARRTGRRSASARSRLRHSRNRTLSCRREARRRWRRSRSISDPGLQSRRPSGSTTSRRSSGSRRTILRGWNRRWLTSALSRSGCTRNARAAVSGSATTRYGASASRAPSGRGKPGRWRPSRKRRTRTSREGRWSRANSTGRRRPCAEKRRLVQARVARPEAIGE